MAVVEFVTEFLGMGGEGMASGACTQGPWDVRGLPPAPSGDAVT